MKNYILIFIFITISAPVFSQSGYTISQALDLYKLEKIMKGDFNSNRPAEDIQGSPYLNDDFVSGTVYTTSKVQYNDVNLRYNIYNDNLEFESDGRVMELAAPEIVEKVIIGNYILHYLPYLLSKKARNGFFILLAEGKVSLYVRPEVAFEEAILPAAYKDAVPAKFVRRADSFYIRSGLNEARVITKQKDLADVFTTGMGKVDEFIKTEKLKINREADLIKIVEYYNSL